MKLIVVGTGGVGKSCCTMVYIKDTFIENYDPTIEESFSKLVHVDGHSVKLEVVDTAGQDEFTQFRDASLRYGDGFFVVYSINDPQSWDEAKGLAVKCARYKEAEPTPPVIVVGNKLDLDDRQVDSEIAGSFCQENKFLFIETSALAKSNVSTAFEELIRRVRNNHPPQQSRKAKCVIL